MWAKDLNLQLYYKRKNADIYFAHKNKSMPLISDKYEEIANAIMTEMRTGVTFLEAEGTYVNNKKKIVYCIAAAVQVAKLTELIYSKDESAFISVNHV